MSIEKACAIVVGCALAEAAYLIGGVPAGLAMVVGTLWGGVAVPWLVEREARR